MNYASHQPHVSNAAMGMFRRQDLGVDDVNWGAPPCTSCGIRGVSHFNPTPPLAGLGDWFSDGLKAVTGSVEGVVGTFTGATAQKAAQENALRLAQVQNERSRIEGESSRQMVMYIAAAVGALGLAGLVIYAAK